jgi:predicted dehydrogenase
MKRREFITTTAGVAAGAAVLSGPVSAAVAGAAKKRLALVGTGDRGTSFWGKRIVENYGDIIEFVGLCDINPGRLELAKTYMGVNCPVFTNFDEMIAKTKPDLVIVTTVDANHHQFIIRAMELGVDVLTEKPLTTDEVKAQAILDAEKRTGRKVIVGFNYRYGILFQPSRNNWPKNPLAKLLPSIFTGI